MTDKIERPNVWVDVNETTPNNGQLVYVIVSEKLGFTLSKYQDGSFTNITGTPKWWRPVGSWSDDEQVLECK
jgi:hypothetical protein